MEATDNGRLHVEVPGDGYHRNLISCQVACPVHTDARSYVLRSAAASAALPAKRRAAVAAFHVSTMRATSSASTGRLRSAR